MVKIPAFYVDLSVGLEMYKRLENVSQSMSSDNGSLPLTRVTIYPPQGAKLDPWQFALIIIGLVVVTSLAILGRDNVFVYQWLIMLIPQVYT